MQNIIPKYRTHSGSSYNIGQYFNVLESYLDNNSLHEIMSNVIFWIVMPYCLVCTYHVEEVVINVLKEAEVQL